MVNRPVTRRTFLGHTGSSLALGALSSVLPYRQLLAAASLEAGSADWPRFGYDLHNTRFNAAERTINPQNVHRLKLKWRFDTVDDHPIQSVPTVIGDSIFLGAGGFYYALDAANGRVRWRYETGRPGEWVGYVTGLTRSSAHYADGRIYFGTGFADVHCVDAASGKQIWKTSMEPDRFLRAQMFYSPVVHDGKVIVGWSSAMAAIACLDADTGAIRWKFRIAHDVPEEYRTGGGSLWTSGAVDETHNIVYNVTGSSKAFMPNDNLYTASIVAHDMDTGELLWYYQAHKQDALDLDFCAHPMIYDARPPARIRGDVRACVAAGNKAGMYCWNRYTGELYWKTMLGIAAASSGPRINATAVAYNKVYLQNTSPGRPPLYVTAALNAYNGDVEWIVPNPSSQSSPISVANGVLYQGMEGSESKVEALDAMTGRRLWEFKLPSSARGGPVVANGALYATNGEPLGWTGEQRPYEYSLHCFTVDGR